MKEKIISSRPVKWLESTKLWQFLSNHPALGKIFNYEIIMYLFCGVLSTVVSFVTQWLATFIPWYPFGSEALLPTTVSWICAVLFAFFVNKIFVFDSPEWNLRTLYREFLPFVGCRLLTLLFEEVFMIVTVDVFHWDQMLCKLIAQVVILIANYIFSKFLIFKKPAKNAEETEIKES